jgi:hypothetical protein
MTDIRFVAVAGRLPSGDAVDASPRKVSVRACASLTMLARVQVKTPSRGINYPRATRRGVLHILARRDGVQGNSEKWQFWDETTHDLQLLLAGRKRHWYQF